MDSLSELTFLLKSLKEVSLKILAKGAGLLRKIEAEDQTLVNSYASKKGSFTTEDIEDLMLGVESMIEDAQKVVDEIPAFVVRGFNNEYFIGTDIDKTPFLSEVWAGDTYDVTETAALRILLKALLARNERMTIYSLIDRVLFDYAAK